MIKKIQHGLNRAIKQKYKRGYGKNIRRQQPKDFQVLNDENTRQCPSTGHEMRARAPASLAGPNVRPEACSAAAQQYLLRDSNPLIISVF